MAYDTSSGGGDNAAVQLSGGSEDQSGQESGGGEDTFFLPSDFPGAGDYKPGDTIPLRVVGQNGDGQLEVECIHDNKPGGGMNRMNQDFREHMGAAAEEM